MDLMLACYRKRGYKVIKYILIPALLTLSVFSATQSHAQCANPDGVGGEQVYNEDFCVMQSCNGTNWLAMGVMPKDCSAAPAATMLGQAACPSGDLSAPTNSGCARLIGADPTDTDDVMIYAGDVPGLTMDFFVRRCDLGMDWTGAACAGGRSTLQWKDVNTESATTNIGSGTAWDNDNARNGPNNTALLVADGTGVHAAAETCDALPNGSWYLPAISEVDVMYANLIATDDPDHPLTTVNNAADDDNSGTTGPIRASFTTDGTWYWSSSERNSTHAWIQRFSDGTQSGSSKANARPVRCARR